MTTNLSLELAWEGRKVRMVGTPERPEWIAKDVCRVLGLHNSAQALADAFVSPHEKGISRTDTLGGPQEVTTVNESGLWKMVFRSRKPSAQRFRAWLAVDVLPSIRKHGCYPPPPEGALVPIDTLNLRDIRQLAPIALQLTMIVEEITAALEEKTRQLALAAPKAECHDRLSGAEGATCIMDAGRVLGQRPRVFAARLVADKILFHASDGTLEPYAEYLARGYFRLRVITVVPGEKEKLVRQTLVTPLGLQWLASRYPGESRSEALVQ
jgi:anti-repressor protein